MNKKRIVNPESRLSLPKYFRKNANESKNPEIMELITKKINNARGNMKNIMQIMHY